MSIINESKMPIIPIEDTKHYSCSEENDTINLENNSNDLNSFQNFLIRNGSNNGSDKCGDNKKSHALIKKEINNNSNNYNCNNNYSFNSNKNLNLVRRKKGVIRKKDSYGSTHLVLGNIRGNRKLRKKLLWNNCTDQNTNVSEMSYIKDFENNSFMHENGHHMVLYDNKYRDYPRNKGEERSEKIKYFFVYSPDIIQRWIRVIFNIIITSLIVTLIYFIFISVREDINKKVAIQVENVKEESNSCKKQYYAHKCGTVNLPLLNEKCEEWLKCMKTDHKLYQDISFLSAQMLGQIINAFIVQFEWKSICVIAFIFLLIFIGSNYALSIGGGSRVNGPEYSLYNPYINANSNIPPFPYYPFYPILPQALHYNNGRNTDIPLMNMSFPQNKFFQNSSFSRNPYNHFSQYTYADEHNTSNNSTSRNKDYSDNYGSSKKDSNKKGSKKLGFLKYLTGGFK
ncbi:nucleus export protein BRR6, putative [Plasmodium malariae]|uniref:Nucleus export protein BRR6, putative n=1 Tax=Plasmodium malariae TaxID=5858 RepID=A0A1C3L2V3_PLAMA|nr:nucleus export protein BRR6, putative [Plasmodium malariae]